MPKDKRSANSARAELKAVVGGPALELLDAAQRLDSKVAIRDETIGLQVDRVLAAIAALTKRLEAINRRELATLRRLRRIQAAP